MGQCYTGERCMNEHKKLARPQHRTAFIDGIVTDGRRLGVPTHRSYRPGNANTAPAIDDIKPRSDGFHPLRQSAGGLGISPAEANENSLLDEPIVLDDIPDTRSKKHKPAQGRSGRGSKLGRILKRSILSLMALILIAGGYFGIKLYLTERHIFKGGGGAPALAEKIDINQLKGEGDGRINILLLGIGGPGHDGPDLTDTILLASIDPVNNSTALLSVPRDLYVKIPGVGSRKLNEAYYWGKAASKAKKLEGQEQDGLKLLDQTLGTVLGVPIHYHSIVDFAAFRQSVDAVGGVDVNAPEELYDPTIAWENGYNSVIATKGLQHMNGAKALLYAKSRETSSDFARGERQRLVLVSLKDKVLTLGTFSNPVKVSNLLSSLGNNVYTDFTLNDITRLYQIIGGIPSNAISSLDLVTPPHNLLTTANINGTSIVQPRAGLFLYDGIQNYVRNALRDGFLAKENSSVAVYNATSTTGLASKEAAILKSYGYNITNIDNTTAPTNPSKTAIVDLSKGLDKYTRHYLEGRFGVVAVTKIPAGLGVIPPTGTHFVIILGKDVASAP